MKLLTIVGARPQFVKAGALSRILREYPSIQEVLVHTGQHYDQGMSDIFFKEMDIPVPRYALGIGNLGHGAMTGRMLERLEEVILTERPDYVLVYGDTNSTIAGALAAKKLFCPVIHVEAGLRSYNMAMPEEINRILTDRISDILFCPTQHAVDNLKVEGFDHFDCRIIRSGDVMEDAARYYSSLIGDDLDFLNNLGLNKNQYILATLHRQENVDNPLVLKEIYSTFDAIHEQFPIILPLHPRTHSRMNTSGISSKVKIIPPVGYFDMIRLIRNSRFVMTDSGGLQKEAYFFGKFCITLRSETEWVELVEHGFNILTGPSKSNILSAAGHLTHLEWPVKIDLYGGGRASRVIAETIIAL